MNSRLFLAGGKRGNHSVVTRQIFAKHNRLKPHGFKELAALPAETLVYFDIEAAAGSEV